MIPEHLQNWDKRKFEYLGKQLGLQKTTAAQDRIVYRTIDPDGKYPLSITLEDEDNCTNKVTLFFGERKLPNGEWEDNKASAIQGMLKIQRESCPESKDYIPVSEEGELKTS